MFITLEGGEGSGKSTLAASLATWLREEFQREIYLTRNPGGTPDTADIRRLIVEGEAGRWDALTEAMLLYSDRRHHWLTEIEPSLARGEIVVCDRFYDSTDVYQGFGRGVEASKLDALREIAIGDVAPDLTLVLDVPVDLGLRRAVGRGGEELRFEGFDKAFHERLRAGYRGLLERNPRRCVGLDGTGPPEALLADAQQVVRARL